MLRIIFPVSPWLWIMDQYWVKILCSLTLLQSISELRILSAVSRITRPRPDPSCDQSCGVPCWVWPGERASSESDNWSVAPDPLLGPPIVMNSVSRLLTLSLDTSDSNIIDEIFCGQLENIWQLQSPHLRSQSLYLLWNREDWRHCLNS